MIKCNNLLFANFGRRLSNSNTIQFDKITF